MGDDLRIAGHPRGAPVTIFLDGKPRRAFEGESVAGALHAEGVVELSRSIKYHRPRGVFCARGECAGCMMRIDGTPNVRACAVPVRDGMRVASQNSFPSARRDFLSVLDRVFRRTFDPHDKFIRPRFLVPAYNWVIRRMAGFGRVPDRAPRPRPITVSRPDVVVAGAGASGLSAAVEASRDGRRVVLLEAAADPGGRLRDRGREGLDLADALSAEARKLGVDVRRSAPVVARYADGATLALERGALLELRPAALVVATGSHDVPPLFPNNDLPGILTARAAATLVHRDGVRPGRVAVVLGEGDDADEARRLLESAGVRVAAVVPAIDEATGGTRVEAVRAPGVGRVACDVVVSAGGRAPRPELAQQAGAATKFDPETRCVVPVVDEDGRTTAPGVWVCGEAAGPRSVERSLADGRRVGEAVRRSLASGGGA